MPRPVTERFDTARLVAQRITLKHFPEIHRLHSDSQVMRTLSADGNVMSEEASRKHLERCAGHWDQHGFGLWVFRARSDDQFIGRGGLMTYQIDGVDNLRLALPGYDDLAESDAYGQSDEGIVEVSFGLANSAIGFDGEVRKAIKSIREVDISWEKNRKLATVPCECAK